MATETQAVPTTSPASPSKISSAYREGLRQASGEDSRVAALVKKADPAGTLVAVAPEVKETPKPPVTKPEAVAADTSTAPNPDQGLIDAVKPTDKETNLANLRKKAEEAERRATDAEARLKDFDLTRSERDKFKTDRDTLEQALERYNVEASPRFQEKYDKPQKQELDSIRRTLAVTDANADNFIALVQMPESRERTMKLSESFAALDDISKGKIASSISSFDKLRDARTQELSNPTEAFQGVVQDQKQRTEKQRKDHEAVIDETLTRAQKLIGWFNPIEGNDAWNAQVEDVKAQARRMWTQSTSPNELAENTVAGAMAPKLMKIVEMSRLEIDRLNEELAQYREATPKNGAGNQPREAKVSTGPSPGAHGRGTGKAWEAFRTGSGIK